MLYFGGGRCPFAAGRHGHCVDQYVLKGDVAPESWRRAAAAAVTELMEKIEQQNDRDVCDFPARDRRAAINRLYAVTAGRPSTDGRGSSHFPSTISALNPPMYSRCASRPHALRHTACQTSQDVKNQDAWFIYEHRGVISSLFYIALSLCKWLTTL